MPCQDQVTSEESMIQGVAPTKKQQELTLSSTTSPNLPQIVIFLTCLVGLSCSLYQCVEKRWRGSQNKAHKQSAVNAEGGP
jgi:hypothetical protein